MSSGFFKKFFSKKEMDSSELFWIYTQCDKCGEKFKTLIRKNNDLAPTYKNEGPAFILRKELIGASCPNRINLYLEFDRSYRKISEEITGGHFISKEEYQS
jgi:hypothetical protein